MKRSSFRSRISKLSSFTLVELLVVIGIIAILAAVLMSAGQAAIRAALRAKANTTANQMQTGILSYFTEYGVYPVPTGTTTDYFIQDTTNNAAAWGALVDALCGNINPSTGATVTGSISNVRSIPFLSFKSTDVDTNGAPLNPLPYGSGSARELYFNVGMDSDYSGVLGGTGVTNLPNFSAANTSSTWLTGGGGMTTAGVAVWANCNTTGTNAQYWVHTY